MYSPDVESSPAPSSSAEPHMTSLGNKQTSRTSSFEIENLLKTAEQVSNKLFYFAIHKWATVLADKKILCFNFTQKNLCTIDLNFYCVLSIQFQ